MDYEVSISECKRWVETKVSCEIHLESALKFITAAAQVAEDHGVECFLFDVRGSSNIMSPLDDYRITRHHLPGLGFTGVSRVALLVSPGDTTHDFFEVTARNVGHIWRVFDDEQTAVEWLKAKCRRGLAQRGLRVSAESGRHELGDPSTGDM